MTETTVAAAQPLEFDWRLQPRDPRGRWTEGGSWARPGKGTSIIGFLQKGAESYRRKRGLPDLGSSVNVMGDPHTSKAASEAYQALPSDDPKSHKAYDVFAREIEDQYKFVTTPVSRGGLGIKVEVVNFDPYHTHREMVEDVLHHRRIRVMATDVTGPHPRLTNEQNDKFRAIHDLFGHAGTGRPFDRNGEEAAWFEHASMFSEEARGPMTTETRGQNGVLIHTGSFPEQKVGLLPKHFYSDEALRQVRRSGKQRLVHLVSEETSTIQASAIQIAPLKVTQALEFACHDDACAPPPAGTGGSLPGVKTLIRDVKDAIHKGGRVSASRPTGKKDPAGPELSIPVRLTPGLHSEKQQVAVLSRIALIPGFEDTKDMDTKTATKVVLDRLSRNIEEGFERSVEDYGLERTLQHANWYPVAHQEAVRWSKEFGYHEDTMFAVIAVLSPSSDWGDNVAWARFVTQKMRNQDNIVITQEMVNAYEAAQQIAYRTKVKKFESGKQRTKPTPPEPSGIPVGKRLSELTNGQAAQAIRGMGNLEGLMQGVFGNPTTKARANSDASIEKAVSLLRDESSINIDKQLGQGHKVRSFYNNLREPRDRKYEDVTADTHHFGAAFGHPWPGSSPFLSSGHRDSSGKPLPNRNIWGGIETGKTGAEGAYPYVAEATRMATVAINAKHHLDLRPNQMQSVVWEYHRNSWPSSARTASVRDKIEEIRTAEAGGHLTHEAAVNQIEAIRSTAPGAAPRDQLLNQLLGTYKPTKRTRQRVVKNA